MPLKIPSTSPNLKEFTDILVRYKGHAEVCDTCRVEACNEPCTIGRLILSELHAIPDVIWTPNPPTNLN